MNGESSFAPCPDAAALLSAADTDRMPIAVAKKMGYRIVKLTLPNHRGLSETCDDEGKRMWVIEGEI